MIAADLGQIAPERSPTGEGPFAQEDPDRGIVVLPGGYVDDRGTLHREVELAPLTGREEEYLAELPDRATTASAISGLLARCIRRIGTLKDIRLADIRNMVVGDRDYLAVKLREMTLGREIGAVLYCRNPACRKPMDISFSLDDVVIEQKPIERRFFTLPNAPDSSAPQDIEFRLPTGGDQEALAGIFERDEAQALNRLMARCLRRIGSSAPLDVAQVEALSGPVRLTIEQAIEQLAPQVDFELDVICPECASAFTTPFDLPAFFLAEMRGNIQRLRREVHFLAWHYHWSEQAILSMNRRKRMEYIELVSEELERLNAHE